MNPPTSADTDTFDELDRSAIDDLQLVAPLILNTELRDRVLPRFDGPHRLEIQETLTHAARLVSMTEWREGQLLDELGCPLRTVGEFDGVELEPLQNCQGFLRLVARDAGLVELRNDRRQVVRESSRLLKMVDGQVGILEGLLETQVEGYTAIDFIRLGEIEAAGETVRGLCGVSLLGQEAGENDPFAEAPTVHLSTSRLAMLAEGRSDDLGAEVARHMELHIELCQGGCREAFDRERISVLTH
jgi:hypothetical protein